MPNDDIALLREYARQNSEAAFATLVSRHVNLVYSVALRSARDPHLAGEITQAVFIILARKADSLGDKIILSGWLCRAARYASANALTIQRRRQKREQEAFMQSILESGGDAASPAIGEETWNQIAPLLDGALEKLGQKDHDALVLRFFENKNFVEVGAALGASEDAAKMRVSRALEKLRKFFGKRGVSSTTAIIAGAISAQSVQAAPIGLAKTISAAAMIKGTAASTSTLTLVKGALKIMAWTKMKTAIVASVIVLLAAGTTTVTVQKIHEHQNEAWQLGELRSDFLLQPPYQTVILPTRASERNPKLGIGGMASAKNGQVFGINMSIKDMMRVAFITSQADYGTINNQDVSEQRTIFMAQVPTNHYDFISNLRIGSREALQRELKQRFGIVGRFETIETNVLLLKVKYPNSNRKLGNSNYGSFDVGNGKISLNGSADNLAKELESCCKIPIINQTGLAGNYDFEIKWDNHGKLIGASDYPDFDALKQALVDQLGLELVPTNMPIEMLVVEKVK